MWLQYVAGLPGHGKWWAETRAVFKADLLSTMPGEIVFSCDNPRKDGSVRIQWSPNTEQNAS